MAQPSSLPFDSLHEIADGVLVWIGGDSRSGVSNAGVVVDDDGLTVVDTLMVRSQWEPFAAAVHALGPRVRRVVLTHAHIEQVGGTKAFTHAAVYGSPPTSDALDLPMPVSAYQAFMPSFAEELEELGELGTRPVTHLVTDAASLTARVEVLPVTGHTGGDLLVLVADADVCFLGGIGSFGVAPLAFQGDPVQWAGLLDAVVELADTLVPANGMPGSEPEARVLQGYLRACVSAAGTEHARFPAGSWDDWKERGSRDAINVERAALLASGRDELPPSMLAAMGFD